jgi:hypothetical protein
LLVLDWFVVACAEPATTLVRGIAAAGEAEAIGAPAVSTPAPVTTIPPRSTAAAFVERMGLGPELRPRRFWNMALLPLVNSYDPRSICVGR